MLNGKGTNWCASQGKPRGARLQVFCGHRCPVSGEKTVLLGLESGFRWSACCPWQTPNWGREQGPHCWKFVHKCWGPLCFQIWSQEALGMVQRQGLTLSSFTVRITICLWQSPVYPDSKQLERPNYQMLCFSFFTIKHPTLCFWKSWQGKKVNIWAVRRRSALWWWPDDSCFPCAELHDVQCVFPHTVSSALTSAALRLPRGLFWGSRRGRASRAVACWANAGSHCCGSHFMDEDIKVRGCAQSYRQ